MQFRVSRPGGHWEADFMPRWEQLDIMLAQPDSGVCTPLHPGVIDQHFADCPGFYWIPERRVIS